MGEQYAIEFCRPIHHAGTEDKLREQGRAFMKGAIAAQQPCRIVSEHEWIEQVAGVRRVCSKTIIERAQ